MGVSNIFARGSRFLFWGIVPIGAVLLGALTFTTRDWKPQTACLIATLDFTFLLFALGLYNPRRFSWALRSVFGIVFLAYCWFVVDEFMHKSSLWTLHGLIAIGIPAGLYAIRGFAIKRKTSRPYPSKTAPPPIHPQ